MIRSFDAARNIPTLVVIAASLAAGILFQPYLMTTEAQETARAKTSLEAKIDSQLLQALETTQGKLAPQGLASAVRVGADGRTLVDIKATVTKSLLDRIRALGGSIVSSFPQYHSIRASVPINHLKDLAAMPEVSFIRPAEAPSLNVSP